MSKMQVSENVGALELFASGGDVVPDTAARDGAREVLDENRRLRSILAAMSRADLGDGALVEINRAKGRVELVVCCGSQSEVELGAVVMAGLRGLFAEAGHAVEFDRAEIQGVTRG